VGCPKTVLMPIKTAAAMAALKSNRHGLFIHVLKHSHPASQAYGPGGPATVQLAEPTGPTEGFITHQMRRGALELVMRGICGRSRACKERPGISNK